MDLPPTNPNSFWSIASYHGMPFKYREVPLLGDESKKDSSGTSNDKVRELETMWGGYCQHANVLFPFWHRLYCHRLEQALQSVLEKGKERVALHYWDESSEETKKKGLPDIVTHKKVKIGGKSVSNPLFKFTLPMPINDYVPNKKEDVPSFDVNSKFYQKEVGYDTCRYPYSGIRNPDAAKEAADRHNASIKEEDAIPLLQENIKRWLLGGNTGEVCKPPEACELVMGVAEQFERCLETQEYNPFSNTTSAGCDKLGSFASIEQPHNDLHLAVGGFTQPEINKDGSVKEDAQGNVKLLGPIHGANGDMGANEVAAYDPVFFLHHSNIDRMLWVWQKKHKKTNPGPFTIDNSDENDQGISNSRQGATPYQTWGQKLNENTILYPFQDEYGVPRKSLDCIDIVSQLGYDYSIGSLDRQDWPEPEEVKTISLLHKRVEDIRSELEDFERKKKKRSATGPQRLRLIFDLTQLPEMQECFPGMPMLPHAPFDFEIKGLHCRLEDFIQVLDVSKDKISGSFLVQVFYRATTGKLYYLGQRGVLSRWSRSNCANCQERRMADISILIKRVDSAHFDLKKNLEVHLVGKDGMNGKYITEVIPGKDLAADGSAPGKQKPLLRIVRVLSLY